VLLFAEFDFVSVILESAIRASSANRVSRSFVSCSRTPFASIAGGPILPRPTHAPLATWMTVSTDILRDWAISRGENQPCAPNLGYAFSPIATICVFPALSEFLQGGYRSVQALIKNSLQVNHYFEFTCFGTEILSFQRIIRAEADSDPWVSRGLLFF
jgi:hypothetical protein